MTVGDNAHFDLIVVGGGASGNVVAGRLAENPSVRILVIEVGPRDSKDHEDIRTPAEAMSLRNSKYDWAYKTTMIDRDDYERDQRNVGRVLRFYAKREVVVCQRVSESPKLLVLSSISPEAELKKHNIPVLVKSPWVGQNLLDHPGVPFVLEVKDRFGMDDYIFHPGTAHHETALKAYADKHGGPLGSGFLEVVGFPRIDKYLEACPEYRDAKASNDGKDPFCPYGQPHFELDFVCLFGSAFQWHYLTPSKGNYMTVMVDLVRPVSEPGRVTLNSADPLQQAHINLDYFNNELDVIAIREGIRYAYDVLKHGEGFKDIVVAEYPFPMPLHDDKLMNRTVLERSQTSFHPCGTARLSRSIEQGVVDPGLKVHGAKILRVIDASCIPVIPDCRIQNSVYMVAEKGADAIKADHKDLYKQL